MVYKKIEKFLFIGLLFVSIPSINAMEREATENAIDEMTLEEAIAEMTLQEEEYYLADPNTPNSVKAQILQKRSSVTMTK